jgi:hypothetical protein
MYDSQPDAKLVRGLTLSSAAPNDSEQSDGRALKARVMTQRGDVVAVLAVGGRRIAGAARWLRSWRR